MYGYSEDVRAMMGWAMVAFRNPAHPLYISGANYDRLIAKLANSVVEKEQSQWKERQTPILKEKLDDRLARYLMSSVKHMHAQHKEVQNGGGK